MQTQPQSETLPEAPHLREARFQALKETIKSVFNHIQEDELLGAMKEDTTSFEFLNQRVKEIFEEVIENEREAYIEKLIGQYNYVKGLFKNMEDEMKKVGLLFSYNFKNGIYFFW
jgi:hypothetical protein